MLKVRIGGTLESRKDFSKIVECKNDIRIVCDCNRYELFGIADIIASALTELLPSLTEHLGTDGLAKFALTMNEPLIEWSKSVLNK